MDPVAQGRGIGKALLAQAEVEVRARGGRLLVIETSDTPAYASARRFYESNGYKHEALVHDFYGPGDNLLIFAKELAPGRHRTDALGTYPDVSSEPLAEILCPDLANTVSENGR